MPSAACLPVSTAFIASVEKLFVEDYKALLANTGEAQAADLAARFGIDIRSKAFWAASLAQVGEQIERCYRDLIFR